MTPRMLEARLSVLPQIQPDDVPALAALGFRSILSNRPDGEADDQPGRAAIEAAATAAGLRFAHQPVVAGAIEAGDIARFRSLLETLPAPVLAFCRTGTRSTMLWALSQARDRPVARLLERAALAGYDLSAQAARMEAIAATAGRDGAGAVEHPSSGHH